MAGLAYTRDKSMPGRHNDGRGEGYQALRQIGVLALLAIVALCVGLVRGELSPTNGGGADTFVIAADTVGATSRRGYVWSATRSESEIRLRGQVPSEDVRTTVLGMIKASFPGLEVEDRMSVAQGAPPVDQWLGAVSFSLQQLARLKHGSVRLLNVDFRVEGEAASAQDLAEIQKAFGGTLPAGLTVIGNNVRPPRADPFVFVASRGPEAVALTGSVPNERTRKQLRDLSRQLFERSALDDKLELASGAPKNWNDAVVASLKALSRLESGKVSLTGQTLTIEGIAIDKVTAADIASQLRRELPSMFSTSDKISWKEASLYR
jgi:hypothetical protein